MTVAPLPVGGHVEVAVARRPDLVLLHQQRPDQADDRVTVGEDTDDALTAANLLVEPLDTVGGAQALAVGRRQREDGGRVLKAALQGLDRARRAGLVVGDKGRQQRARGRLVGRLEDRTQAGVHFFLEGFGRGVGDVGRQVGLAALPGGALELHLHGLDQPTVVVGDDQIDAGQATAFEPGEEVHPRALTLAVADLQAQHLAVASFVDAGRHQRADRPHPPVFAHFDHQRIHEHEGVALPAQVALVPGRHQRIETLAQVGDRGLGEARATQLLSDAGHFARRDAVDHHLHQGEDEGLFTALVACEQLGRELAVTDLWNLSRVSAPTRVVSWRGL